MTGRGVYQAETMAGNGGTAFTFGTNSIKLAMVMNPAGTCQVFAISDLEPGSALECIKYCLRWLMNQYDQ